MIVVLGPAELAEALVATAPGELVVSARDDDRLGHDVVVAAEVASALPLPARACVVPAWTDPVVACEAARAAGGSLANTRLYVVGDPPSGTELAVWNVQIGRAGAIPVRDIEELRAALEGKPSTRREAGSAGDAAPPARLSAEERKAMRPGAPEAAAWRAALRAAPTGRLPRLLRRRKLADSEKPEPALDATIRRALRPGAHSIAVLSPKGGVGKTTLTYMLGSVLARVRRERVLVVDTNPDFGTLADLAPAIVPATLSDLLRDLDSISSYEELSSYTTTTETGMHILGAPQDPVEMVRLGREGYRAVSDVLHRHYDVVIYDCGTGFLDELTQFALRRVDQVVLVTTPSLVTTKIIVSAIDHLSATGFHPSHTTLAVNMVRRHDLLDRGRLRTAMSARIGGTVEVPFDEKVQHAMDTGEFRYGSLSSATRLAMKRLGAEVVGRMPGPEPGAPAAEPVAPPEPERAPEHAIVQQAAAAEPTLNFGPADEPERAESNGRPVSEHAITQRGRRLAFDWDPHDEH